MIKIIVMAVVCNGIHGIYLNTIAGRIASGQADRPNLAVEVSMNGKCLRSVTAILNPSRNYSETTINKHNFQRNLHELT